MFSGRTRCLCLPFHACRGWLQVDRSPASKIDLQALLRTAAEVAQAMAYLHENDVIHADLTGNNVLLTKSAADARGFTAMVGDFGLARVASEGTMNTNNFGTVSHMPPELLADGTLTKAADVYAFGVLVWEMYNGTRAFVGRRAPTIIHAVTSGSSQLTMPDFAPADLTVSGPHLGTICTIRCMFCTRGKGGLARSLLPHETVDQVLVTACLAVSTRRCAAMQALVTACLSFSHKARPTFAQILDSLAPMLAGATNV